MHLFPVVLNFERCLAINNRGDPRITVERKRSCQVPAAIITNLDFVEDIANEMTALIANEIQPVQQLPKLVQIPAVKIECMHRKLPKMRRPQTLPIKTLYRTF